MILSKLGSRGAASVLCPISPPSHPWRRIQCSVPALAAEPTSAKILIVDDDEAVTAETGLREAEQTHPDAIILDLRMPLLDGLGFLRRLRAIAEQRRTPVAIVTGDYFLDDSVSEELRDLGAELRFKPLWLEDLVGLARNLLKVTH
jgi:response regulator RpfG family c-di-GMP phosphodiesterase